MTGKEAISKLTKAGWQVLKGRGKGAHTMMAHPDKPGKVIIPSGELKIKTLRSIEKATGEELQTQGASSPGQSR